VKLSVILFAVAATACGSSDSTAEFIGTWTYSPGATETVTCNGGNPSTESVTGSLTIAAGVSDPLAVTSGSCTLTFDVSGDVATVTTGQSCSSTGSGTTAVTTFSTLTLTLGNPTTMLTEVLMGNGTLSGVETGTCTLAGTVTATKVAQ
jgi:hypothetical protein